MTVLTDTLIEDQRTLRGAKVGQNLMHIHRLQESYHKNRRIRLDVLANRINGCLYESCCVSFKHYFARKLCEHVEGGKTSITRKKKGITLYELTCKQRNCFYPF